MVHVRKIRTLFTHPSSYSLAQDKLPIRLAFSDEELWVSERLGTENIR